MGMNNVNVEGAEKFLNEVKSNPHAARKIKRVEGEWVFEEGKPQFKSVLAFPRGETVIECDLLPFMGGAGLAPDPLQYCLYGLASCYAGTFVSTAAMMGTGLKGLKIAAENHLNLSASLGLGSDPIVEGVELTVMVSSDAPKEKLEEIAAIARERCPGVYCVSKPVPLTTRVVKK